MADFLSRNGGGDAGWMAPRPELGVCGEGGVVGWNLQRGNKCGDKR